MKLLAPGAPDHSPPPHLSLAGLGLGWGVWLQLTQPDGEGHIWLGRRAQLVGPGGRSQARGQLCLLKSCQGWTQAASVCFSKKSSHSAPC